jgi:hypothetical protein
VSTFGRDVRRLRPNLMIGGVAGLAERHWSGAILRLPGAEVGFAKALAQQQVFVAARMVIHYSTTGM